MGANTLFFGVAAAGYLVCGYLLWMYSSRKDPDSFGSFLSGGAFGYRELLLISILGLFFEMLMIRWISSEIQIFAYFKNFVLIACFLGFGLGCSQCRRKIHPVAFIAPMGFFTLLLGTRLAGIHAVVGRLTNLIGSTSQIQIWNLGPTETLTHVQNLLLASTCIVPLFALLVFMFIPIGQQVGSLLERAPRGVTGYTVNVIGSLIGILLYTALCFFYQPPAVWFLVAALFATILFLKRRRVLLMLVGACLFTAALLTLMRTEEPRVFWSPYQKLTLSSEKDASGEVTALSLTTNGAWYQMILNLSPAYLNSHPALFIGDPSWQAYNVPYHFSPNPKSVLVLGSGMGNDVAAVLRNTSADVTAVEIDPLILELGQHYHPEHPYQSSRVHIVNNDARSYIQNSHEKFDLLLFSLLDSHTTASSYSNIRIDNYVYTVEAMRRSRQLLKPNGLMVVKFLAMEPWIAARLRGVLREAFQNDALELTAYQGSGIGGNFYFAGSDQVLQGILSNPESAARFNHPAKTPVDLTTDDWPYFYQKERGVPVAVVGMSVVLLLLSFVLVKKIVRPDAGLPGPWRVHFLFLGAGFMLLEAQIISKMALLFGTTWVVNSIVVSGLLLLIVCANLIYGTVGEMPVTIPYAAIFAAIVLTYLLPLRLMFFPQIAARIAIASLVLCLPVLFASMVFIRSFAQVKFAGDALGWNLLGAVLGGMLETISQATGLKALLILTAVLYLASWVALARTERSNRQRAVLAAVEA